MRSYRGWPGSLRTLVGVAVQTRLSEAIVGGTIGRLLHGSPKRHHSSWIGRRREIRKFDLLLCRLLFCDVLELALGNDDDRSHRAH